MDEAHQTFFDSLLGERIAGRYVVERALRSGGMGLVAAGRYPELEQEVAIKFMRPELAADPILSARFLREARLAARVKSPHFVRVFDFGRLASGVPYLVMEMLTGRDLRDELTTRGALPIEVAVDFVLQAAVGIAEVHALGVVHRDLKPSNLFLSEAAGAETIKVLDFGVSKEKHGDDKSSLTSTGNLVGTPQYMSPEQVRESKTADVRSDIWSLGVILYELLTDNVPFGGDGETIGEIYGLILHTDPFPLRARRAELPAELEAVVHRCLRRSADERYATVGELADALTPFASAASRARIDAVHKTLATVRRVASEDDVPSIPRSVGAPTAESSPAAKRPPSPPPEVRASSASSASSGAPETSMTASRASEVPLVLRGAAKKRTPAWGIALAVVGLVAVGAGVMYRNRPESRGAAAGIAPLSAAVASPPPPPAAAAAVTASPSAAPTPSTTPVSSPPVVAVVAAPAAVTPARRGEGTSAPGVNAPHARHSASPSASASARPASPPLTASPADLILDRK